MKQKSRGGRVWKRMWVWGDYQVEAYTKSEARGKFKRLLKLKRLPVGAVVYEVLE